MPMERTKLKDDDEPVADATIPEELLQLERGLRINKNLLDEDLERHPDLFYRVSREVMLARSRRDQLKLRKEQKEAELDAQVRLSWSDSDPKMTETGVRNKIMLMPALKKLASDYVLASSEVDMWQALKEAFDQRGYALKDLVSLYNSGYWSPEGKVKEKQGQARRSDPAFQRLRS